MRASSPVARHRSSRRRWHRRRRRSRRRRSDWARRDPSFPLASSPWQLAQFSAKICAPAACRVLRRRRRRPATGRRRRPFGSRRATGCRRGRRPASARRRVSGCGELMPTRRVSMMVVVVAAPQPGARRRGSESPVRRRRSRRGRPRSCRRRAQAPVCVHHAHQFGIGADVCDRLSPPSVRSKPTGPLAARRSARRGTSAD